MADAFGAARRVDHVDRFALRDRLVGTSRLADIAVDSEFVDLQGHGKGSRGWAKRASPFSFSFEGEGRDGDAVVAGIAGCPPLHPHPNPPLAGEGLIASLRLDEDVGHVRRASSAEHKSELQSQMRLSYAVLFLEKKIRCTDDTKQYIIYT